MRGEWAIGIIEWHEIRLRRIDSRIKSRKSGMILFPPSDPVFLLSAGTVQKSDFKSRYKTVECAFAEEWEEESWIYF